MKINATFWIKEEDGEEFSIPMSMNDLSAPPFKVGDKIAISIDDLRKKDVDNFHPETAEKFKRENNKLKDRLDLQTIEITKVLNFARFNNLNDGSLTYEYYCQILPDINGK